MHIRSVAPVILAVLLFPAAVQAQDNGYFAGLDVYGGGAFGSSSTTDGGAPFAGGGIVDNVKFGATWGVGGHAGYAFDSGISTFLSYQHFQGDVSWDATFPLYGVASGFDGKATSNVVLANLGYDLALSDATTIRTTAGAGISFNSLSDVVETDVGTGLFLSDVENHTRTSPAAQIGVGVDHAFSSNTVLSLSALVSYTGGFETGDTRSGNLGVTEINPYKIDDVWRANLGASFRYRF